MARYKISEEICSNHESVRALFKKEVPEFRHLEKGDWALCLQWGKYVYDDGTEEEGYRFIWRKDSGNLQPARGQARLPSLKVAELLIQAAREAGWGGRVT